MTAIVLAGGRGRRMNADKAGLDVGGQTLLEHVLGQIGPHFDEVLISLSPGQKTVPLSPGRRPPTHRRGSPGPVPALRVRVVHDETPGLGPLGGLLAGLKGATHEACAVVACDIPDIDKALLRSLAEAAADAAIAVPVGPSGLYEPLFAVYRRSIIPEIESLLGRGERSLLPLYETCRTAVVRFDESGRIRNLNTREDYEDYLRSLGRRSTGSPASGGEKRKKRRYGGKIGSAQSPGRGTRP